MEIIQLINTNTLLDNNKTKYQSGDTISGAVNIRLSGQLDLSRVKIVLRSMAEVKWNETFGTVYYKEGHEYNDSEEYLNATFEIPDNIRKTVITAGSHSIPFVFILPDNIPSSVDTDLGSIRYWIEVNINDDSSNKQDYIDRKYFNVESPLRERLHLSVGARTEKDAGILFFGNAKVCVDASIGKKGHIPGETVEVHCLVTNTSTVAVTPRAQLYQTQIFMAKHRHKTVEYCDDIVIGEQVNAGETGEQTISVQIPNDMPLSMKTKLISIKYFIHIKLNIPHSYSLTLNLPIIVTKLP